MNNLFKIGYSSENFINCHTTSNLVTHKQERDRKLTKSERERERNAERRQSAIRVQHNEVENVVLHNLWAAPEKSLQTSAERLLDYKFSFKCNNYKSYFNLPTSKL